MQSFAVVKDFDVIEQSRLGLGRAGELAGAPINQFQLESAPKRLHHRIVVTVTLSAHRRTGSHSLERLAVVVAGILHPAIGMKN